MKFGIVDEGYILGGVSRLEGRRLAEWAGSVEEGCIVEVGSHVGGSTSWISMGVLKAGRKTEVWAVDLWDLELEGRNAHYADALIYARFRAQMEMLVAVGRGVPVNHIRGASLDVARDWDKPIGLMHVDALHTFDACYADMDAWGAHVLVGGLMVVHDYFDERMGVMRAVDTWMSRHNTWRLEGKYRSDWGANRRGQIALRKVG